MKSNLISDWNWNFAGQICFSITVLNSTVEFRQFWAIYEIEFLAWSACPSVECLFQQQIVLWHLPAD